MECTDQFFAGRAKLLGAPRGDPDPSAAGRTGGVTPAVKVAEGRQCSGEVLRRRQNLRQNQVLRKTRLTSVQPRTREALCRPLLNGEDPGRYLNTGRIGRPGVPH